MRVGGVYNGLKVDNSQPSHRAAIPSIFNVTINNSDTSGTLMDIERATYYRRGTLSNDVEVSYQLKWYAHRSLHHLYVMELKVDTDHDVDVSFNTNGNTGRMLSGDLEESSFAPAAGTDTPQVACGKTITAETPESGTIDVCVAYTAIPQILHVKKSDSGKKFVFVSSYRTSIDADSKTSSGGLTLSQLAVEDHQSAMKDQSTLFRMHKQGWSDLWKSGVSLQGRDDVAIALNVSLYSILSAVREDHVHGLSPGGLNDAYEGHSFWDVETWMYPSMMFFYPSIARSLLQYRYDRLDGARLKAKSYNPPFSGTMFPWESARTGEEVCPGWAATGTREDHISGDIAFAVWNTYLTNEDEDFLRAVAWPILNGVADFWMSFITFTTNPDGTRVAHINDVIPPDEYADHVSDSVFTNYVASLSLQYAAKAAEILKIEDCLNCPLYNQVASEIVIVYDADRKYHPEYSGYVYNQKVKQADVVLLHYPLGMNMTKEVQKNDLDYYGTVTDPNGPAMTWGMHSISYLDVGDVHNANIFLNKSFAENINPPYNVWSEVVGGRGAPNFITGAGGFLQTIVNGFCGVRLTPGTLTFTPVCVESATSVELKSLTFLGNALNIKYKCYPVSSNPQFPTLVVVTVTGQEAHHPLMVRGPVYMYDDHVDESNSHDTSISKVGSSALNTFSTVFSVRPTFQITKLVEISGSSSSEI